MSDDILNTIEVLTARARAKEAELSELKKLINGLCTEAKIDLKYADVPTVSGASLRSDQFYGQTLTAALRGYLEYRKLSGQGAAPVNDIFKGIKSGGYKFETNNEDNQKIATSNALRKSSSIFHRLPTGFYGLLSWYPNAKESEQPSQPAKKHRGRKSKNAHKTTPAPASKPEAIPDAANGTSGTTNGSSGKGVTFKEIRDVILAQAGNFTRADIESALKAKFPSREVPKTKVPSVIFILKSPKKGVLKEVSARSGKKAAVYAKV